MGAFLATLAAHATTAQSINPKAVTIQVLDFMVCPPGPAWLIMKNHYIAESSRDNRLVERSKKPISWGWKGNFRWWGKVVIYDREGSLHGSTRLRRIDSGRAKGVENE
jgi:hypothetical protein